MNKKGFLLGEETVKIVVAVICIIFLIFLLVSVYYAVTGGQKSKEAAASLNGANGLAKYVESINAGAVPRADGFPVPNPVGWYIFSFVGENKKPNLCTGKNCLCICKKVLVNPFNIFDNRQIQLCDDNGACAVVENLMEFNKIGIDRKITWLLIEKINGQIEIRKK